MKLHLGHHPPRRLPTRRLVEKAFVPDHWGGVGPYLILFARAGIGREAPDSAVEALEIHELPSARGCTYVVPASDFALALKVGQSFGGEMKTAEKLGVTEREIATLCEAVMSALAKSPLEPGELREVLGSAVHNLGEEGKRKGSPPRFPWRSANCKRPVRSAVSR